MPNAVSLDAVLTRLNDAIHQLNILALRQDELENRMESTNILAALAVHEEVVRLADRKVEAMADALARRQQDGEEDLVG